MTTSPLPIYATNSLQVAASSDDLWRISVEQYHEMLKRGIVSDGDPVELLEGLLVRKMNKNPPHSVVTDLVGEALRMVLPSGWFVSYQNPLTTEESEPEPDLKIVRGAMRDFLTRHPRSDEVDLVVEIADTSLDRDRGIKKRIYARAGIPCYWIVNLVERMVEMYSDPSGAADVPSFRSRHDYKPLEQIPLILAGQEVARIEVGDFLP